MSRATFTDYDLRAAWVRAVRLKECCGTEIRFSEELDTYLAKVGREMDYSADPRKLEARLQEKARAVPVSVWDRGYRGINNRMKTVEVNGFSQGYLRLAGSNGGKLYSEAYRLTADQEARLADLQQAYQELKESFNEAERKLNRELDELFLSVEALTPERLKELQTEAMQPGKGEEREEKGATDGERTTDGAALAGAGDDHAGVPGRGA